MRISLIVKGKITQFQKDQIQEILRIEGCTELVSTLDGISIARQDPRIVYRAFIVTPTEISRTLEIPTDRWDARKTVTERDEAIIEASPIVIIAQEKEQITKEIRYSWKKKKKTIIIPAIKRD